MVSSPSYRTLNGTPSDEHGGGMMEKISTSLDRAFKITERGSTIGNEVRSGLVTFMTMSYILLVNPQILCSQGEGHPTCIPKSDVVLGTAVSSSIACFIAGFFGNLPIGNLSSF